MFQPVPPPIYEAGRDVRQLFDSGTLVKGIKFPATYIDPDSLGARLPSGLGLLSLGPELGNDQAKHVLAAAEEKLACGVICSSLRLVKAFEGILLVGLGTSLMRL